MNSAQHEDQSECILIAIEGFSYLVEESATTCRHKTPFSTQPCHSEDNSEETSIAVLSDRCQQQLKRREKVDILAGGDAAIFSSGSTSTLN